MRIYRDRAGRGDMRIPMYKNYIFDLYGTLADIRTDEESPRLWNEMSALYRKYGADYEPEELHRKFRELEQKEIEKRPGEDVEINLSNVFAALYYEKGVQCGSGLVVMTAVTFRELSRSRLALYDGVTELLDTLKARSKGVYLLSNAQTDFTRPEILTLGIGHYFDGIFISSEQGIKKPAKALFEKFLDTYGLLAKDCVMIGNDEACDIAGALSVGMDCLYIHTEISPRETGKYEATYRVMDGDFKKIKDLILS